MQAGSQARPEMEKHELGSLEEKTKNKKVPCRLVWAARTALSRKKKAPCKLAENNGKGIAMPGVLM
jgi:hypothetical protein